MAESPDAKFVFANAATAAAASTGLLPHPVLL
jgi:hypothetical protein